MQKRIIAIGGGEIKNKTTLEIDRYVASLAKEHAGENRANALFIGTASHDSMPYFNSFRKILICFCHCNYLFCIYFHTNHLK